MLKMMVTDGISDEQLSFIVEQTIQEADGNGDGKISFDEFCKVSGAMQQRVVRCCLHADSSLDLHTLITSLSSSLSPLADSAKHRRRQPHDHPFLRGAPRHHCRNPFPPVPTAASFP